MVSVSGFFFIDIPVKIQVPDFGVVGEYVDIICVYSGSEDFKMMINNNAVNATKTNATTLSFQLHSEKKQAFKVRCPPSPEMREIQFGYKPDFNYGLERNVDRNIWLFITSAFEDGDQYFHVECKNSKNKSDWFNCDETSINTTAYMYLTENWLYFQFNISSSNKYSFVTKSETILKENIPIRFPQLSNILFTPLPSVDPFQQYGEIKLTYSNIGMNGYYLIYELKYWSDDPRFGKLQTLRNHNNTFILERLLPYTMYNVAARVKKKEKGLWNPPLTMKFMTDTAPSNPPRTTNGSYYLWNCTETGVGKCITVYWEKVPSNLVNGKLKGYCVQIIDENNLTDRCQDPGYLTRNSLYKEFKDLPPNKALTFSITAVNNDERKPQATILQVGRKVSKGPKSVYVIEEEENLYNVSWLLHPHQEVNNVTIFFCQKNDVSTPRMNCMDNVRWEKATNESYLLVNNSVKPLVFAAYISTKEEMSPLTKAECIFKPGKPKKPKEPEILLSENKLTVLWPEFTCESLNGIPVAYEILYNKGPKCDDGSKIQFKPMGIKPPESSFAIQKLDFETKYTVCIRVVTENYASLMSDPVTRTTLSAENKNTLAIVGGLFGTLGGICFIALVIYFIMKYKKEKEAINIDLPEANAEDHSASNSTFQLEYTTIESKDTKEHQNKVNGISNSNSYMRAELNSNSTDVMENDCDTSANTTTSLVSSESIPLSSANGRKHRNPEHDEVQDKSVNKVNFENPENFYEIPENSDMKNPENLSNLSTKNVEVKYMFPMEQEVVNNLTKDHTGVISQDIELNNMLGCPGYVIVGDHCPSPQTSTNNSNEMLLPGRDSDSLGYSTSNDIPTTNTSDPSFSMSLQTPNESFEEESYDNTGYVTAEYTKAVEDSENTVIPECVSNDNLFPVQQTPADIPQEQDIPTKRLNSIEDSKTNCSYGYVLAENSSPSHQILST
eukprot:XP_014781386.1 PREDICTED: uncharacterized protein LOC106877106 isoform X1 [Octopus bimaculoides]